MKLFKPCLTALFAVVFSVLFAPLHAQYVGVGQSLITNPPKPTWVWDFAGANGSYSFPATTPTTLYIGQYADRNLQGTIESLAYYRGSRPDALVQGVSR